MLKEDFEKILNEYLQQRTEIKTTSAPIFKYITHKFKSHLSQLVDSSKYGINAKAGFGTLAEIPWADFVDDVSSNVNVAYLFKADMSGVYLVLRVFYYAELQKKYGSYLFDFLKNKSRYVREFLNESHFDTDDLLEEIDLANQVKKNLNKKEGVIFAKFYKKDNIPSDNELIEDLNNFLKMADYVINEYEDELYLTSDEWISALNDENIIDSKMLSILDIIYNSTDYTASYSDIINIRSELGFENEKSYTSIIVANSKRVKDKFNKKPFYNKKNKEEFWSLFFFGKKRSGNFEFTLRDELIDAFSKIDNKENINVDEDKTIGVDEDMDDIKVENKNFDSFFEYLLDKGFLFEKETIENYLLSIKVKPFVILTGNSGTGKTKLSQLFAQYLIEKYGYNQIYKIVPVGANWTENRHILGYSNILDDGKYQSTPAYELIKESQKSENPYFLILDEMNLSYVERYFADFLSAIESNEKIPIIGEEDLDVPNNLFIIGTVNVDETTYMFSPKVLDRANTIEFTTYSAKDYIKGDFNISAPKGDIEFLENPLSNIDLRTLGINDLRKIFSGVRVDNEDFIELISDEILKFQSILKKSGFDFGFRVINEILRFMVASWIYEGKPANFTNWKRYFDSQIKQKMLPKIHGQEKVILGSLEELIDACEDSYPSSKEKLEEMIDVLNKQRYVSFIN